MIITSIDTFRRDDNFALVRVRTDDGAEGWGQTSPYLASQSAALIESTVSTFFLGTNPWDLEATIETMVRATWKFYGTVLWRALCGIDTAVWDLLGKATGQPVYRLIGGKLRDSIPLYGSSMRRDISPQDEADRLVGLQRSHGFGAFKIRIGDNMGRDRDVYRGRTEEIIRVCRERLGDGVVLHADANSGYSVAEAIRVGRLLEDQGYGHFEEPCPYPQIENTARVAAALDIPIAAGEQDQLLDQFHRIIQMRGVDIIQPDIGYCGGISRARRVTSMAEAAGIPTTPHCANQSMLQMFTLHLAVSQPSVYQFQEWNIEPFEWVNGYFDGLPEVIDGSVTLTEDPGWGVEIDPDFVAKALKTRSAL
ncbi:mandelate racemase/muconate lactonizing enzyme family protein [Subtercola frigoramans]|uniref:L-alanine-DL-glutamate epimerase-like enolase superfamily enzyme n=1 Tax=Subtercola frigoramans TaxID=120298 RepID=A0ABS2L1Q6_9MICO|nr:mandelate racemase/muconate lactonizing enzyme family protein [Subtercola frigoramans]MBM7470871.1 L-alanine-DL-glutamate epimerase-like enolase superfamily enzyme [Subtercola frigoramans]